VINKFTTYFNVHIADWLTDRWAIIQ